MAYLQFNKHELGNLEYSLKREYLATNRAGGYLSTTLSGCNIRKYHGLLVVPIDALGGDNHVLLSSLDETVIQHNQAFNLGIHRYPGTYEPRGHKYIVDFALDTIPVITYRVGGVILQKEILLAHNKDQVLIRYTLLEAHSPTTLRLKPFLAFRNAHQLTRANMDAHIFHSHAKNGIGNCLYPGFPTLYMQLNVKHEFVSCPDWYKDIEYKQEQARGYDYQEDLFVPGYFECPIKKGQCVVFSASLTEETPNRLNIFFEKELSIRPHRRSFLDCLKLSASQFIIRRGADTEIVAGYPWFGRWGRDTFVALPGLTLAAHYDPQACREVIDTSVRDRRSKLTEGTSVDGPLWFLWAVQQYALTTGEAAALWRDYGEAMKRILRLFRKGLPHVEMRENGLIWAQHPGRALTWMNSQIEGVPVTPRGGYNVDVNALWYNAVCQVLEWARTFGDTAFVDEFGAIPALVEEHFLPMFWIEERQHLADFVDQYGPNKFMRPNQLFACSLPYSPIDDQTKNAVLEAIEKELLTPRGLRTLAPKNALFAGVYEGNHTTRDYAYHQGTVRPWLISHYIEAQFRLHGAAFVSRAQELVNAYEEDIAEHGVGSIPELYDGIPPYHLHGCISHAGSVAALLRAMKLIEQYQTL